MFTVDSGNWSGYEAENGPFTYVTGTFTVPTLVNGTPDADALSEWVGIDGVNDTSLIQAGISERIDPSNPNLVLVNPWWEILARPETPIANIALAEGNEITVTIGQLSGSDWGITLTNDTNGETFTTDQTYTGPGSSVEWILEAPESSPGVQTTLAPYGPAVTFSDLRFVGSDTTQIELFMVQAGDQVSTPSALVSDSFNVAYGDVAPAAP